MDTNTILIIAIAAVLVILLFIIFVLRKQQKKPPNYRALFILGLVFLPLGISTDNYGFMAVSALFMIIGLANRKKWDKPKKWSELSYTERRLKITLLIVLSLLLIFGMITFLIVEK